MQHVIVLIWPTWDARDLMPKLSLHQLDTSGVVRTCGVQGRRYLLSTLFFKFFFFTYLVYVRWQDLSLSTSVLGAEVLVFSLARFKHWTIWESICAYTLTVLVLMNQLWAAAAWLWHQLDEKKHLHDCLSTDDMPGLVGCLFLSASMEVEGVQRHAPTHSPETQSYSFYKSPLNLICSLHCL